MKKKMRKNLVVIMTVILFVLIVLLIAMGVMKKGKTSTLDDQGKETAQISLDENIMINSIEPYTGIFVEDGTDAEVEDILSITVKNVGEQTLQYAEVKMNFGDTTAEFAFSTLKPGEAMVVLEKNGLSYSKAVEPDNCQMENVVYFSEEPDMCSDKFEISAMDEAFNIKNVSGEDLDGIVAVYYKNKTEQGYLGGITYRVVIEGGIAKDEIKQIVANHYSVDKSQIVFVDYTEME